jgi:hypothetical protein
MKKSTVSVTSPLFLILLNALIWLAFAIITVSGLHSTIPDGALIRWVMSILSFLTSVFLIGVYYLLRRNGGFAYYLLLGMLALISVLTITDEFGLLDLLVLIINAFTFLLLIKDRAFYIQ